MERENHISEKHIEGSQLAVGRGIRRRLAEKVGAGLLTTSIATSVGAPVIASEIEESSSRDSIELRLGEVEKDSTVVLKDFIEQKGNEPITFEEATSLIPYIASFYSMNFPDSSLSPDEMEERAYFITKGFTDEDFDFFNENRTGIERNEALVDNSPLFKRILEDYPDLELDKNISSETIRRIYLTFQEHMIMDKGLEFGGNIVNLILNTDVKPNMPEMIYGLTIDGDDITITLINATNESSWMQSQVDGLDNMECETATSAVGFVTAQLHELVHLDHTAVKDEMSTKKLDRKLLKPASVLLGDRRKVRSGEASGFTLRLKLKPEDSEGQEERVSFTGLNEFIVQYLAMNALSDNGIASMTYGIKSPQSIDNFRKIMDQSGISFDELVRMHRESDLEKLLIQVARGAKGVNLTTRDERLRFGFRKFQPLINGEYDWFNKFSAHFDGLNVVLDIETGKFIAENSRGCNV